MSFVNKIKLFAVYSAYIKCIIKWIKIQAYIWASITNKIQFRFIWRLSSSSNGKFSLEVDWKFIFFFVWIIKFTSVHLMICHENVMKWNDSKYFENHLQNGINEFWILKIIKIKHISGWAKGYWISNYFLCNRHCVLESI